MIALDRVRTPEELLPAIDRAFTLKGFGTVVTGTLLSGALAAEEHVALLPAPPGGPELRVRSLQVHGQTTARALAGQRTAVNLPGVEAAAISRGKAADEFTRAELRPSLADFGEDAIGPSLARLAALGLVVPLEDASAWRMTAQGWARMRHAGLAG